MPLFLNHNEDLANELDLKLNIQNETFAHLRKESLDLFNRLHSIEEDIKFVEQVHDAYPDIPLLPNLRCGAWYTSNSPDISAPYPAYFKSTDGHTSNWKFNLRRPNLHLLSLIAQSGGLILVDSTRAGKRIPDALSKTVPIWCAVINAAILLKFPEEVDKQNWDVSLHTPPTSVSRQEHDQIEKLLPGWAVALNNSTYTLPKLSRPLRPIWITPASSTFPKFHGESGFLPIICVSASKQMELGMDRRTGGYAYVQGSGDDHELWGMGLTPSVFWANQQTILSASRNEVSDVVASVVHNSKSNQEMGVPPTEISKVDSRLLLCALKDIRVGVGVAYVLLSHEEQFESEAHVNLDERGTILRIFIPEGKKGQMHFLQVVLPRSMDFIQSCLSQGLPVCVACPTGNDLGVGIAVAALQKFFNSDGVFVGAESAEVPDKSTIRTRLEWIISDRPEANPSRNTLKRVNEYLLSSTAFRISSTKKLQ
ncbi:tRNA A64-2'-O-ribosylphosphate transferase [Paramarasmius palmivorus]|uniref:tRNA A64-2'-O-ribosylphosphate transferase n=1 Tax=Paramarasmius palmivorus TaxID=297713 RepID=A0AAW0DPM1_9AGAR